MHRRTWGEHPDLRTGLSRPQQCSMRGIARYAGPASCDAPSEGGDEGLADQRIAVAGFECGLTGVRVISAGNSRPSPQARRIDCRPSQGWSAGKVMSIVTSRPARVITRYRCTSVSPPSGTALAASAPCRSMTDSAGHAVDTVNQPRPQVRPPLPDQLRPAGVLGRARPVPFADDPLRPSVTPACHREWPGPRQRPAQRGVAWQGRPRGEPGELRLTHLIQAIDGLSRR